MKTWGSILLLTTTMGLEAQAPQGAEVAPLSRGPGQILEVPTRAKPQVLEGRMSKGANAPVYAAPGSAQSPGIPQRAYHTFPLSVPPDTKLKATLKATPGYFRVFFVSADMGRTPDPGLAVNRILGRQDAAFYENRTSSVKQINCIVMGLEPMDNEPYTIVLTDF